MKQIIILITLVFITFNSIAYSQKLKWGVDLSEIRKNKNHLELDVKSVFSGLSGASFLYKRTFQSGKLINVNSINLMRTFLSFDNQFSFSNDKKVNLDVNSYFYNYLRNNSLNLNFGIGLEKQYMRKILTHYFGIDALLTISNSEYAISRYYYTNQPISGVDFRVDKYFQIGVNPFFGIKYYLSQYFNIGIETGLAIAYFNRNFNDTNYEVETIDFERKITTHKYSPIKNNGIRSYFNNLRFLNVGYTF